MAAKALKLLLIEILFVQVLATYLQQTQQYFQVPGQQYYQLSGTPPPTVPHAYTPSVPTTYQPTVSSPIPTAYQPTVSSPIPTAYQPTISSPIQTAYQPTVSSAYFDYSAYPTVTSPYSTAEKTSSYTTPVTAPVQPPKLSYSTNSATESNIIPKITPPGFDSNVLNNLAIALQLLIVSNLLNTPISEHIPKHNIPNPAPVPTSAEYETVQTINPVSSYYASTSYSNRYPGTSSAPSVSQSYSSLPQPREYEAYYETNPYDQTSNTQYSLPNANYLGSSHNLGGLLSSLGVPPATARPGLNLKSPYDAIASVPFSENMSSSPFEYTKKDFQSPYSSISATDNIKDLFSMDFY